MVTNFFRINIPLETFQIQRLAYSNEKLAALRRQLSRLGTITWVRRLCHACDSC